MFIANAYEWHLTDVFKYRTMEYIWSLCCSNSLWMWVISDSKCLGVDISVWPPRRIGMDQCMISGLKHHSFPSLNGLYISIQLSCTANLLSLFFWMKIVIAKLNKEVLNFRFNWTIYRLAYKASRVIKLNIFFLSISIKSFGYIMSTITIIFFSFPGGRHSTI